MTWLGNEARRAAELLATRTPEELEDPEFIEALLQGETQLEELASKLIARKDRATLRVQALKAERDLIDQQIARWERYVEQQDAIGMEALDIAGVSNIRTPRGTLYRKAGVESVVIVNEDEVPPKFKETKTTTSVLKVSVKKAIKAGEAVPGAVLSNGAPTLAIKR